MNELSHAERKEKKLTYSSRDDRMYSWIASFQCFPSQILTTLWTPGPARWHKWILCSPWLTLSHQGLKVLKKCANRKFHLGVLTSCQAKAFLDRGRGQGQRWRWDKRVTYEESRWHQTSQNFCESLGMELSYLSRSRVQNNQSPWGV